jgi:hypothetical protein
MSVELDDVEGDRPGGRTLTGASLGEANCDSGDSEELDLSSSRLRLTWAELSMLRFRAPTESSR